MKVTTVISLDENSWYEFKPTIKNLQDLIEASDEGGSMADEFDGITSEEDWGFR